MAFLRPVALWALPLVLIPLIIHLIHRRRFQTVNWAAMSFLLQAAESDLGRRKLQRSLLLMARMLAIAAIVLAMARPIRYAGGGMFDWLTRPLGLSSTFVVLIDRSPSMQRTLPDGRTLLQASVQGLESVLTRIAPAKTVLIDSVAMKPLEIASVEDLSRLPIVSPADSSADIPRMLVLATEWLSERDLQAAEVFVCSDLRTADWRPTSSGWDSLRQRLSSRATETRWRFHASTGSDLSIANAWIRADKIRQTGSTDQVLLSIQVGKQPATSETLSVEVDVGGVSETLEIKLNDGIGVAEHFVDAPTPGPGSAENALRLTLPPDGNSSDNEFLTRLDSTRPSIGLVAQEPAAALETAVEVMGNLSWSADAPEDIRQRQPAPIGIVWQGALPSGASADALTEFLRAGGSVMCFPPRSAASMTRFHGVRWGSWSSDQPARVISDRDLEIRSTCPPLLTEAVTTNDTTTASVIHRTMVGRGELIFVGADVVSESSELIRDGVGLLQLIEMLANASSRSPERSVVAGETLAAKLEGKTLRPVQTPGESSSRDRPRISTSEPGHHAGFYEQEEPTSDRWIAINRPESEDATDVVEFERLATLTSTPWNPWKLDADSGQRQTWLRQGWAIAWIGLLAFLFLEGWLSLPRTTPRHQA